MQKILIKIYLFLSLFLVNVNTREKMFEYWLYIKCHFNLNRWTKASSVVDTVDSSHFG